MKTAIYIEDGAVQLVITPETQFEKNSLKSFGVAGIDATIFQGAFYDCRGGWVRQTAYTEQDGNIYQGFRDGEDVSLIIKVSEEKTPLPEES